MVANIKFKVQIKKQTKNPCGLRLGGCNYVSLIKPGTLFSAMESPF